MSKIVYLFLVVFCLFGNSVLEAQNSLIIKGKVVNASDNLPVAYANIGVEGTFLGTATNDEGDFMLKVPEETKEKNLLFSAVGYKNLVMKMVDLAGKDQVIIRLAPQSYDISEIDISARSQVINRILRTASEKIPENFLPGPFSLTGNYENEKVVNDTLTLSLKAGINLNDRTGYTTPGKLSAYRDRGYSFQDVSKNFKSYSFPDGSTNMDEVLDFDWARSRASVLNPGLLRTFDLFKAEDQQIDGETVYVIAFRQKVPTLEGSGEFRASRLDGKIYIATGSYAVRNIEIRTEAPVQNRQGRGLAAGKGDSSLLKDVKTEFTISYRSGVPAQITMNKHYLFKGNKVAEQTRLTFTGKHPLSPEVAIRRDYFLGD